MADDLSKIDRVIVADIGSSSSKLIDEFGRLKVANPVAIHDSKQVFDAQPLYWSNSVTGAGASITYNKAGAKSILAVSTASGDKVISQTKKYMTYQPGRSTVIMMTGVMGQSKAGVRVRFGYFDADNGLFFELTEHGMYVVLRSSVSGSPVDTRVHEDDWNGPDVGLTEIDWCKAQIFAITFQWLGVGRVRFGIASSGGGFLFLHEFLNANINSTVYMSTPVLPVRYEIENLTETASATTCDRICNVVLVEGGEDLQIQPHSVEWIGSKVISTTYTPLISLQLKSDYNRATVILEAFGVLVSSASDKFHIQIIQNGTLTGASFGSAGANSYCNFDSAATAITGGEVIYSSTGTSDQQLSDVPLGKRFGLASDIAGTSDIVTIAVRSNSGNVTFVAANLNFGEVL
jgi:hypothetical protein